MNCFRYCIWTVVLGFLSAITVNNCVPCFAESVRILNSQAKKLLIRGPLDIQALQTTATSLNQDVVAKLLDTIGAKLRSVAVEHNITIATEPSETMKLLIQSSKAGTELAQLKQQLVNEIGKLKIEVDSVASHSKDPLARELSLVSKDLASAQNSIR